MDEVISATQPEGLRPSLPEEAIVHATSSPGGIEKLTLGGGSGAHQGEAGWQPDGT
jgi:hypothetical protein